MLAAAHREYAEIKYGSSWVPIWRCSGLRASHACTKTSRMTITAWYWAGEDAEPSRTTLATAMASGRFRNAMSHSPLAPTPCDSACAAASKDAARAGSRLAIRREAATAGG